MPDFSRSSTAAPSCCRLAWTSGCRWKRRRERLRFGRFDQILATHILAAFGHIEAAAVERIEGLLPAVVGDVQPMRAGGLLTVHLNIDGAAAKALWLEFAAVEIADHQGGMGGGGAGGVVPLRRTGQEGAAVDDHPVAADRQFHRQGAGMSEAIQSGRRRRTAIDDQHAATGLHAMEAALSQCRRASTTPPGLGQHKVDEGAGFFARAVEQG